MLVLDKEVIRLHQRDHVRPGQIHDELPLIGLLDDLVEVSLNQQFGRLFDVLITELLTVTF